MLVYRLGKTEFSRDLSGQGAKLYGGRWNNVGTACLYTSQSRALAILEYSVNVSVQFIQKDLSFTVIEIDDKSIFEINKNELPVNWSVIPTPSSTKIFGSNLMLNSGYPILRVPSVIIDKEYNFLLNPSYIANNVFRILDVEPFQFDFRIK